MAKCSLSCARSMGFYVAFRRLPSASIVPWTSMPQLNLRVRCRAQDQVRDVAHDLLEGIARVARQLLPPRIAAERLPLLSQIGQLGIAEHVGQVGHTRPNQGVAVEDLVEARLLKVFELALVEHLDLAHVVAKAGALVGAKLEDTLAVLRGRGRRSQLRVPGKGAKQRAFSADKRGCGGRRAPERLGGLHEGFVFD